MNTSDLERMKEQVALTYAESPGGDLDGMLADIQGTLGRSDILANITTHKTGSRTHLIEVRSRRSAPGVSAQRIATELQRAWLEDLRYDDFEDHRIEVTDTTVILDFVTGSNAARLYVTGMIVIDLR